MTHAGHPGDAVAPASDGAPVAPPVVDPLVEGLWPPSVSEFTVATLRTWTQQKLRLELVGDPLRDNALLNKWEFANGKTVLESFPWRLSVPFVLCNAQCDFCAAWLMQGKSSLDELMTSLIPVIRHCYQLDLVGWGEPLIHPQFAAILEMIRRESDPRARVALTTNGTRLDNWIDRLLDANVMDYAISIHATNKATHQDLMGFGPDVFDQVISAVRSLTAKKAQFHKLNVELVFLVTRQNIAEIPDFLQMSEDLGADQVHLRTLMPMGSPREGLDYHRLPPYLHPNFDRLRDAAVSAISKSRLRVNANPATWSQPVFSPEWESQLADIPLTSRKGRKSYKISEQQWDTLGAGEPSRDREPCEFAENPLNRKSPLYCPSPYTAFYVNGTDRRVIPCVYMHKVPHHEFIHFKPLMTFKDVWNAPAMVAVRRSLHYGPLMSPCLKCPFHC
jgi:pyruvate-formate lyase-activating enzyme